MGDGPGYGIATVPDQAASSLASGALTDVLGCTALKVHGVRRSAGESLTLPSEHECVVVPVGPTATGATNRGLGRAPPGEPWTVKAEANCTLLVFFAPAPRDGTSVQWIDLATVEYTVPSTSDIATAHLTPALGCTGLKANARMIKPGQAVPLHTEGTQEELFVPLGTGGSMRLGDETVATPPGSIVRVAPDVPRSARNEGDTATEWLMFGAPPTGEPTGWDPGARILADNGEGGTTT